MVYASLWWATEQLFVHWIEQNLLETWFLLKLNIWWIFRNPGGTVLLSSSIFVLIVCHTPVLGAIIVSREMDAHLSPSFSPLMMHTFALEAVSGVCVFWRAKWTDYVNILSSVCPSSVTKSPLLGYFLGFRADDGKQTGICCSNMFLVHSRVKSQRKGIY